MEMEATGKSKGEWIFHAEFHETIDYLSDHARILAFNPFCHKVEKTAKTNVYKWHFRVTDPQNNPFDVIFYIEEIQELLVELPDEYDNIDPETIPDDIISKHTVGRKITWAHHPWDNTIDDPKNYIFEGRAFAEMYVKPHSNAQTMVDFDLRVDVKFTLYPAFRIIPETIIRSMTNAGMSFIMQSATDKMFKSISKDFRPIQQA